MLFESNRQKKKQLCNTCTIYDHDSIVTATTTTTRRKSKTNTRTLFILLLVVFVVYIVPVVHCETIATRINSSSSSSRLCYNCQQQQQQQQKQRLLSSRLSSIGGAIAFQQQQQGRRNRNKSIVQNELTTIFIPTTITNNRYMIKARYNLQRILNQYNQRPSSCRLSMTNNNNNNNNDNNDDDGKQTDNSILQRFINPIIDDTALPISDAMTAQIIGPGLQLGWLVLVNGPRPTWCTPFVFSSSTTTLFASNNAGTGSLIVPTLLHGAALAVCWLIGSLAAQAYRRSAISPTLVKKNVNDNRSTENTNNNDADDYYWDYSTVFWTLVQAGSFASGLLILCTQIDVFTEYKAQYIGYMLSTTVTDGNTELDFRTLIASTEVINDIFFEGITIGFWRFYLAYQTSKDVYL